MEKLLKEIMDYSKSCTLSDDIDDRCYTAAFSGVIKGLQLSKKYTEQEINEIIKKYAHE